MGQSPSSSPPSSDGSSTLLATTDTSSSTTHPTTNTTNLSTSSSSTSSSSSSQHQPASARPIPAPVKRPIAGVTPRPSPPTNVDGIGAALEGTTPITLSGVSTAGGGGGIAAAGTSVNNNANNNNNDGFTAGSPQPVSLSARVATLLEGHHEGSDTKLPAAGTSSGDSGAGSNGTGTVTGPTRAESPPLLHHQTTVETVPTTFKWSHGGAAVFLTGSFNNWQGKIPMTRSDDNPKEVSINPFSTTHQGSDLLLRVIASQLN
jgi:hypothetical protein